MNPMTSVDGQVDQILGSAYQVIKYVAVNMETLITLAQSVDPLVNSVQTAFEALRRTYAESGYVLLKASFKTGAAVGQVNHVLIDDTTGVAYSWGGALPKFVPERSTVESSGGIGASAWIPRELSSLRQDLSQPNGVSMVGGAVSSTQLNQSTGASLIGVPNGMSLANYLSIGAGINPDMIAGPLSDVGKLQAAVDLWATDRTKWITLWRPFDLTGGTVYVANPESHAPESQLVIFGGELKKLDTGFMFDKPLGIGQMESTGGLRFKGTRFFGPQVAGTYVINGHHDFLGLDDSTHILRVAFEGCMGVGIQAVYARDTGYVQSITFDSNCVWRRWAGYIVDVGRLYDLQMINMRSEAGDAVIRTRDDNAPLSCLGLVILGGNIEGNLGTSGPAIHVGACSGTTISPNYMEFNQGGDIDCSRSLNYHKGLTIQGVRCEPSPAQLSNPNYYPIELGRGVDGSINVGGNHSTGNLYNCGVNNPASIVDSSSSCGDGYRKYSPRILDKLNFGKNGFEATSSLGGAVGADYGNSMFYHQDPASTDTKERAYTGAVYAAPTAVTHPGVIFGKGSFLLNRGAAQVARTYGGVDRIVELLGWKCIETGAPGTWREVTVLVPY